jgi:alpha-glucosidase (family GH31 glycosyl hydrolase)
VTDNDLRLHIRPSSRHRPLVALQLLLRRMSLPLPWFPRLLLRRLSRHSVPFWVLVLVVIPVRGFCYIGDYRDHVVLQDGVRIEAGDDTLYLRLYASDIVRVDFRPQVWDGRETDLVVTRRPDPSVGFRVEDTGSALELVTADLIVHMDKSPFRFSFLDGLGWDLLAEPDSGGLEAPGRISRARFVLPADLHLYGTGERGIGIDLRSHSFGMYNSQVYGYGGPLESMKISVPFLATSGGYALYFDTAPPGGFDLGRSDPERFFYEQPSRGLSFFLLVAPTVAGQLERYTWLTGRQPMPPKWALGYLQSKYGYRTRGEAETMVRTMRARRIPCDAIILDLYWFANMGDIAWDVDAFPNPPGMMADFLEEGFKTILITEPYFDEYSQYYYQLTGPLKAFVAHNWLGEAYLLGGWWACNCDAVLFDVTNPDACEWLWDRYEDLFRSGAAGLWTDLGEPERHPWDMEHYGGSAEEVHNIYNFLWAKTIYDGSTSFRPQGRVFNLTRSGYAGIQRYGVFTWSGDVSRTFGGLAVQVPIMLNTSLSGLAYHSSDLGGFTGWASPELYVRWMEFGTFNPVMRAHGADNQNTEPWGRGPDAERIVTDYIRLRYRLLPYLYSLSWENHETGMPLVRPLFFYDSQDPNLAGLSDAFLLGADLLVAPVTGDGIRQRDVYLPKGNWVDFWTDSLRAGPGSVAADAPLDRIPLFVREGAILPMQPSMNYVDELPPDTLIVHVYPPFQPRREAFTLYEDDGLSRAYEAGGFALTSLAQELVRGEADTTLRITIGAASQGFSNLPQVRTVLTVVHLTASAPRRVRRDSLSLVSRASLDSLMLGGDGYFYDTGTGLLRIKVDQDPYRPSTLEVSGWRIRDGKPDEETGGGAELGLNRPNPFTTQTRIPYSIADGGRVTVEVFSPGGKKVATLVDHAEAPGPHNAFWDGRDLHGRRSAPGVYFCRLVCGHHTDTGKIVLLR